MKAKPKQWGTEYASIFKDESVVEAYQFRPVYPAEVFEILMALVQPTDKPWQVLDAGCGTGFIARELISYVDKIDAVDVSKAMIDRGRTLPRGDTPNLQWIYDPIEEVSLRSSYSLIVAAASLHWMDWEAVLPRFAQVLSEKGYLAVVEDVALPTSWDQEVGEILGRYSMNRDFQPYDMIQVVEELEKRVLFERVGMAETKPVIFRQPIEAWIESIHARNGFSRDRMGKAEAAGCDEQLREVIGRHCPEGTVARSIEGRVIWGKPKDGDKEAG